MAAWKMLAEVFSKPVHLRNVQLLHERSSLNQDDMRTAESFGDKFQEFQATACATPNRSAACV